MVLSARAQFKIPFHDIDIMNIAWHGHYLKYFEIARTALMQSVDLDWPVLKGHNIAMPIVEAQTQYRKPIQYDQEIVVEASIEEYAFPELIIHYRIFAHDQATELLSSGRTRQVYRNLEEQNSYFVVPELVIKRFHAAAKRGIKSCEHT